MLRISGIILAVAMLLSFSLAIAEEEIENLARNGDFENDLLEWKLNQNIRGSVASMEIDKKDVIEGKKSVHIKIDVQGADFHTVRIEQTGHKVVQNEEYTMSAWLKAEKERNAKFHIFDVAGGAPWFTFLSEQVEIGPEWSEYFGTFDATQDSDNVSISVRVGELDIDVWVDDIRFYEGEYVPSELQKEKAVAARGKLATTWGSIKTQY